MSLDPDRLGAALTTPVSVVGTTGSTNADLRHMARQGAAHGTCRIADHQTAGRGRLGRTWRSPSGDNLLLSVLIRSPLPASRTGLLCLGAAVAVAEVVGASYGIKWPNDVLAPDGRKVAGVLAEAEWASPGILGFAVIGVGLNVRSAPDLPTATCLAEVGGCDLDRTALAIALVEGILGQSRDVADDPARMLARWRRRCVTLGQRVRIGAAIGEALDVETDGALRIRGDDGIVRRIVAGDVEPGLH